MVSTFDLIQQPLTKNINKHIMKNLFYLTLLLFAGVFITACDKDENHDHEETADFDYRIDINSPSVEAKQLGDSMHIHVDFVSELDAIVHHANVRIFSKTTGVEVYNAPGEAHVHEESGTFSWHDDFNLTEANGILGHSDWILEAKVWGHSEGLEEVVKSIEFHVHPH